MVRDGTADSTVTVRSSYLRRRRRSSRAGLRLRDGSDTVNGRCGHARPRRSVDAVSELRVIRAGLVPYQDAWRMQRELHAARVADAAPDTVLLLRAPSGVHSRQAHRAVGTTPRRHARHRGRSRREDHLARSRAAGRLPDRASFPGPLDVVAYVRRMEQLLIDVCAELGLPTLRVAGTNRRLAAGRCRSALSARSRRSGFASRGE